MLLKNILKRAIVCGVIISASFQQAQAALLTVDFSGALTSYTHFFGAVPDVEPGDAVSGQFTFDTALLQPAAFSPPNVYALSNPGGFRYSYDFSMGGLDTNAGNVFVTLLTDRLQIGIFPGEHFAYHLDFNTPSPVNTLADLEGLNFALIDAGIGDYATPGGRFDFTLGSVRVFSDAAPVAPTPLPGALALFVSALGGMGWFARRKKALV